MFGTLYYHLDLVHSLFKVRFSKFFFHIQLNTNISRKMFELLQKFCKLIYRLIFLVRAYHNVVVFSGHAEFQSPQLQ